LHAITGSATGPACKLLAVTTLCYLSQSRWHKQGVPANPFHINPIPSFLGKAFILSDREWLDGSMMFKIFVRQQFHGDFLVNPNHCDIKQVDLMYSYQYISLSA
jgi:hypothetical protein